MKLPFNSALFVTGIWATHVATAATVTIPAAPPATAQELPSTHVSFSVEQDRWPGISYYLSFIQSSSLPSLDWVGTNARNEFTHTALTNLGALTGTPPKIRVGADSEDHTTWSPTVTVRSSFLP